MKKIILIFVLLFSVYDYSLADWWELDFTWSICEESRCLNDRIDELIKVNEKLQEENKILQSNYTEFNSWLEYYVKILAESKLQSNEKWNAYDIALNQIKYWSWIVWIILSSVWIIFWIIKGKELQEARKAFETELGNYREYITKIDETLIKSTVISNFYQNQSIIIDELKKYINTDFKYNINSEILSVIKTTVDEEFTLNWKKIKEDIIYEINKEEKMIEENYDKLDSFEWI